MPAGKTVAYGYAVIRPQLSADFTRVLKSQMKKATTGLAAEVSQDFGKKLSNGLRRTVERQADQNVGRFLKRTAASLANGSDVISEAAEAGIGRGLTDGIVRGSRKAQRAVTDAMVHNVSSATDEINRTVTRRLTRMNREVSESTDRMFTRFAKNHGVVTQKVRRAMDDLSSSSLNTKGLSAALDQNLRAGARKRLRALDDLRFAAARKTDLFDGITSKAGDRAWKSYEKNLRNGFFTRAKRFGRDFRQSFNQGVASYDFKDNDLNRMFSKFNRSFVKSLDPKLVSKAAEQYTKDIGNAVSRTDALARFRQSLTKGVAEEAKRGSSLFARNFRPNLDSDGVFRKFLGSTSRRLITSSRNMAQVFGSTFSKAIISPLASIGNTIVSRFRSIGQSAGRALARASVVAIAAGGIGAAIFGANAVKSASDYEQAVLKVNAVFKSTTDRFKEFAKTSAETWGLAETQALSFAGTYGNLLQSFGIAEQKAGDMTLELLKRASDIASMNDVSIEEVLTAIKSGLSGEIEPLKRFGVTVSQMRLEDIAMEKGWVDKRGPLPADIKAMAAFEIIMKDSTIAAGDFARSTGSLAIELKKLQAKFEDFKKDVGVGLIGTVTKGTQVLGALLDQIQAPVTALLTTVGDNLLDLLGRLTPTLSTIVDSFVSLLGQILPPIMNVLSLVVETFSRAFETLVPVVAPILKELVDVLARVIEAIGPDVLSIITTIVSTGAALFLNLVRALEPVVTQVAAILNSAIGQAIPPLAAALTIIFEKLAPLVPQIIDPIARALAALAPVFEPLATVISLIGFLIGKIATSALEGIASAIEQLAPSFKTMAESAATFVDVFIKNFDFGKVSQTFGDLALMLGSLLPPLLDFLLTVGGQLLTGIVNILGAIVEALKPIMPILQRLIVSVTGVLAEKIASVASSVVSLIEKLSPVLLSLVDTLAPIIDSILVALGDVLSELADVFSKIDWQPFINALNTIFGSLALVLPQIATALGNILVALAPVIVELVNGIGKVVEAFAPMIGGILEAILPILPPLVDGFRQVMDALVPILPLIATEFARAVTELTPHLIELARVFVAELIPYLPKFTSLIVMLLENFLPLAPIIGQASAALMQIATFYLPILMPILDELIHEFLFPLFNHWERIVQIINYFIDTGKKALVVIGDFIDRIRALPGDLKEAAGNVWDFLSETFKNTLNKIIDFWNNLKIPSLSIEVDLPLVGKRSIDLPQIDFPDIPRLASGGIITEPTLGLMGETSRARPEIVTPERLMRSVFQDVMRAERSGPRIVNNFDVKTATPHELAQEIAWRQQRQLTGRQR